MDLGKFAGEALRDSDVFKGDGDNVNLVESLPAVSESGAATEHKLWDGGGQRLFAPFYSFVPWMSSEEFHLVINCQNHFSGQI